MNCSVNGCQRPVLIYSRRLCRPHYKRWLRHGNPTAGAAYSHEPLPDRIRRYARVASDGCWMWMAAKNDSGYGLVGVSNRCLLAHRVAYETFVGPIPQGLELDHICKVKSCVNPDHLEPVTRSENVRRGWPDRRRRAEACQS